MLSYQSEDEALAAAIAASLAQSPAVPTQKPAPVPDQDEDEALARAIAASLQDSSQQTPVNSYWPKSLVVNNYCVLRRNQSARKRTLTLAQFPELYIFF